ncbi:Chitinase 4, partial [Basidiobolus ranarum]
RPTTGLCDGVKAWSPKATYNSSQKSTFNGHLWKAKWWTQDESPKNKGVWVDMGAC